MFPFLRRNVFLNRLRAGSEPDEAQRVERIIATARVFLATASLTGIWLHPSQPGRWGNLAYVLLAIYALYSLAVFLWLRLGRQPTYSVLLNIHTVDVLWPTLISFFTEGFIAPFFVFSTFVLLEAAYRWGLRETLATAGIEVILFSGLALLVSLPLRGTYISHEVQMEIDRLVIRGIYLLIMGYLLGYLGEEEKLLRAEIFQAGVTTRRVEAEMGVRKALRTVLGDLLYVYGSEHAFLSLFETTRERIFFWEALRRGEGAHVETVLREANPFLVAEHLFDSPGRAWHASCHDCPENCRISHLVALDESGRRVHNAKWSPPEAFMKTHRFSTILGASFDYGNEGSGQLLILDPQVGADRERAVRFLLVVLQKVIPVLHNMFLAGRLRAKAIALERARMARELHDGVVQALVGLDLHLEVLRRKAPQRPEPILDELKHIHDLLQSEILNVRELMQRMRPVDLAPSEFLSHIASIVERFRRDTGIEVTFIPTPNEISLPPFVCRELAKIIQEALVNVRKHSGARNVLVRFDKEDISWKLVIDDNGRGFNFSGQFGQAELEATRRGPLVIKERVRAIGGELMVESSPGRGARLEIKIPLRAHG